MQLTISWSAVGEGLAKDALITVATGGIGNIVNKGAKAIKQGIKNSRGKTLTIKGKDSWRKEQIQEAKTKAKALTNAETKVVKGNNIDRSGGAQKEFREQNNLGNSRDADHTVDLQLGGKDTLDNICDLDSSVNRSFGAQIQNQIKDLPESTKRGKVIFK